MCDLSQKSPLLHPEMGTMQKIDIAKFVALGEKGQTWELLDTCAELKLNLTLCVAKLLAHHFLFPVCTVQCIFLFITFIDQHDLVMIL